MAAEKESTVKVQVLVSHLSIDLVPGKPEIYKRGQTFICPEIRARKLGKSVKIL